MEALSDDERDVVECNMAFVKSTARALSRSYHEYCELRQVAAIAFGGAVQSCDAEKGALTTHAKRRILAAIQRHREGDRLVHIPSYLINGSKTEKKNTHAYREQAAQIMAGERLEADDRIPSREPEPPMFDEHDYERVRCLLPMLTETQRFVAEKRLDNWTFSQIGKELGCTKEVARWHERRAVAALRNLLINDDAA